MFLPPCTNLVLQRLPFPAEVLDHIRVSRIMKDIRVCPWAVFYYSRRHRMAVSSLSSV